MTVDRDVVLEEVSSFLEVRRTGRGLGGSGNPKETWEDVQSQVAFAMALDPDAVFTLIRWACSDLYKVLQEITASCNEIIDVIPCLYTIPKSIEDLGVLAKGYKRLSRGLTSARISEGDVGAGALIADAAEKLDGFSSTILVGGVGTSGRSMSPAEARSIIKEEWTGIVERLEKVELYLVRIPEAMNAVAGMGKPHAQLIQVLGKAKDKVESVLHRMEMQPARQRGREAARDMAKLAAVTTMISMVSSPSGPSLSRGGPYAAVAAGTGEGAKITGTASAPFRLLTGVSERVNISLDGGGPSGDILVPSQPNSIVVDTAGTDGYYVVTGESFCIRCRGVSGNPVVMPVCPPPITPAQLVNLITAAPGPIPRQGGIDLIVCSWDFLGPALTFMRLELNNAHISIDDPDLGEYIEISGDVASMNAMGFSGHDEGYPSTKTERVFWRPTEGVDVARVLRRNINTGLEVAIGGDVAFTGPALISAYPDSDYVHVSHYYGRSEWFPDQSKLVLLEEGRERVRVGDRVTLNAPGTVVGYVERLVEGEGIILSGVSGSDAEGSYTVGISPVMDFDGLSITFTSDTGNATHRIIGSTFLANEGRILLLLSRPVFTGGLTGGGAVTLPCIVNKDYLSLASSDKGVSGSIQLLAPTTDPAYPGLGMATGLRLSQVSHLYSVGYDFVSDGVVVNDVVAVPGIGNLRVSEVLGPERLRLNTDIPGTFAGTVSIYNHLAWAYQEMLPYLSVWSSPDQDAIRRDVAEVLRVDDPRSAGTSLGNRLAALGIMGQLLLATVDVYIQATKGYPSSLMGACREALIEAGADRAVDLLVQTDLNGFFSATTDDASYQRRMLKSMRIMSRKMLGSSVYSPETEIEQALLLPREELSMDVEPMAMDNMGIPRGNRP